MQKKFELGRMDIVDLYGWHKSDKLQTGPYFQRFSVWRDIDREEFIDTIMNGYPIPSIFICEGDMDLVTLQNTYYVLDGRQRLESIFMFISNEFTYEGRKFEEFNDEEKKKLLNFSIPIIQVYLDKTKENIFKQNIIEIFKRLNKNSYNLNKIEKQTSQYSEYEFIKICKMICGFEAFNSEELEIIKEFEILDEEDEEIYINDREDLSNDIKNMNEYVKNISYLYTEFQRDKKSIFTSYQKTRQINMQHLINLIASIDKGVINRNLKIEETEKYSSPEFITNILIPMLKRLDLSCKVLIEVFENKNLDKWWLSMTNLFTLIYVFYTHEVFKIKTSDEIVNLLMKFKNKAIFEEYSVCCQNSVNDKKIRLKRNEMIEEALELINL